MTNCENFCYDGRYVEEEGFEESAYNVKLKDSDYYNKYDL